MLPLVVNGGGGGGGGMVVINRIKKSRSSSVEIAFRGPGPLGKSHIGLPGFWAPCFEFKVLLLALTANQVSYI